MRILKKCYKKSKEEDKKQQECWYNNYHEQEKSKWVEPEIEGGALSSPNQMYYSTAQQAAKNQNR